MRLRIRFAMPPRSKAADVTVLPVGPGTGKVRASTQHAHSSSASTLGHTGSVDRQSSEEIYASRAT